MILHSAKLVVSVLLILSFVPVGPLYRSVVSSNEMDCCENGFCPMRHHHEEGTQESASAGAAFKCDCGLNSTSLSSLGPMKKGITRLAFRLLTRHTRWVGVEPIEFSMPMAPEILPISPPPQDALSSLIG